MIALAELALQHGERQRVLEQTLNRSLERARTEGWIVSLAGNRIAGCDAPAGTEQTKSCANNRESGTAGGFPPDGYLRLSLGDFVAWPVAECRFRVVVGGPSGWANHGPAHLV